MLNKRFPNSQFYMCNFKSTIVVLNLSIGCSVGYLRAYKDTVPELSPYYEEIDANASLLFGDAGASIADQFCMNNLLEMYGKTSEEMAALDKVLQQIPNKRE